MQLAPNSQPVNISSPYMENIINFSFNIILKTEWSKRRKQSFCILHLDRSGDRWIPTDSLWLS